MKHISNKPKIVYDTFDSPLGMLYLTFSGDSLSGISFIKPADISFIKGAAPKKFIKELASYFKGLNSRFGQKIKFLSGTEFEIKVWHALNEIPYGETKTYKWIAEKIDKPSAVRAVGQALSKNPVPIVIPCHRVIESDGSIGGYSSGMTIKKRLLEMEYYSRLNKKMPCI
jgi:methylated-DNA-[protein]-cysteine S-methyltransferase